MNGQIKELTDTEIRLAFASLCVECAARRLGCTPREMYRRMKRVGLVQAIARKLDPLHTQSREYVTQDIVNASTSAPNAPSTSSTKATPANDCTTNAPDSTSWETSTWWTK